MMVASRTPQFGRPPVRTYRSWSQELETRLVELCADAHFKGQPRETYLRQFVAEFGGRDGNSMAARAHRLGDRIAAVILARAEAGEVVQDAPAPRRALQGPRAAVCELAIQGLSAREIAAKVGAKVSTVENQLCRLRAEGYLPRVRALAHRPDMWTKPELEMVRDLRAKGQIYRDIAAALNAASGGFPLRSEGSVRIVVARMKLGNVIERAEALQAGSRAGGDKAGPTWAEIDRILRAGSVVGVPRGLTAAESDVVARSHLAFVAGRADFGTWTARADLRLCEGLWRGEALADVAAVLKVPAFAVLGRWRLIVGPWVDDRGAVPLGVSALILPILRERAA